MMAAVGKDRTKRANQLTPAPPQKIKYALLAFTICLYPGRGAGDIIEQWRQFRTGDNCCKVNGEFLVELIRTASTSSYRPDIELHCRTLKRFFPPGKNSN